MVSCSKELIQAQRSSSSSLDIRKHTVHNYVFDHSVSQSKHKLPHLNVKEMVLYITVSTNMKIVSCLCIYLRSGSSVPRAGVSRAVVINQWKNQGADQSAGITGHTFKMCTLIMMNNDKVNTLIRNKEKRKSISV